MPKTPQNISFFAPLDIIEKIENEGCNFYFGNMVWQIDSEILTILQDCVSFCSYTYVVTKDTFALLEFLNEEGEPELEVAVPVYLQFLN